MAVKMKKRKNRLKINNSGAALVTAIVVIAFVSVLATIVMYVSGTNYYMKSTDLKTKASFYDAEEALEVIKAELMILADEAFQDAYEQTLIEFVGKTPDQRTALYYEKYVENLTSLLLEKRTQPDSSILTFTDYYKSKVGSDYEAGLTITAANLDEHKPEGYSLLKGVNLTYTKDGYTTIISTDYLIIAPEVDWSIETSLNVWDAGVGLTRDTYEMSDCVTYVNWKKQ